MFTPGNIIYAYFLSTNPPKPKYLISLYRKDNLNIVACFTTSQQRTGVPLHDISHGEICNAKGEVVSYVFLKDQVVATGSAFGDFAFPVQTTVVFDYCFQKNAAIKFERLMKEPKVVGKLLNTEYYNLIYAMYKSNMVADEYKHYFEEVLNEMP